MPGSEHEGTPGKGGTRYRIDESDRIVSVDPGWADFALRNQAPAIATADMRGRLLWDFVGGIETRHLYEALFEAARRRGNPLVVPFRCDSPEIRRFMELEIRPASDGLLDLTARLLRYETREGVALLDSAVPRSEHPLKICSFCKRVRVEGYRWVEVERAVEALDLFGDAPLPKLSHSVCPSCEASTLGILGKQRAPY